MFMDGALKELGAELQHILKIPTQVTRPNLYAEAKVKVEIVQMC